MSVFIRSQIPSSEKGVVYKTGFEFPKIRLALGALMTCKFIILTRNNA